METKEIYQIHLIHRDITYVLLNSDLTQYANNYRFDISSIEEARELIESESYLGKPFEELSASKNTVIGTCQEYYFSHKNHSELLVYINKETKSA